MNTTYLRALGSLESFFASMNQQHSYHFTMASEVTGILTEKDWRRSFSKLVQRHPLLSCEIVKTESGYFFTRNNQPVDLSYMTSQDPQPWQELYAQQLHMAVPNAGPLVRLSVLSCNDLSYLVWSCHHAIADGMALTSLHRELIDLLNDEDLPPDALSEHTDGLLRAQIDSHLFRLPTPVQAQASSPLNYVNSSVPPTIESLCLDQDATQRLLAICRREGTTAHGALCASLILAGRRLSAGWKAAPTRLFTPIDLRKRLGLGNEAVLAISATIQAIAADETKGFWNFAKEISDGVRGATSDAALAGFSEVFRMLVEAHSKPENLAEHFSHNLAFELMVSNLKVVPSPRKTGSISLRAIWGPSFLARLEGEQSIGIATFDGSLRMLHSSYHIISGLLPAASRLLEEACAS